MAYFDATGRRIPLNVADPAVAYHLTQIFQAISHQEHYLKQLVVANERIAAALERIALQYAGPAPAIDQEVKQ